MDDANAQQPNASRSRARGVYDMDRQRNVITRLYWDKDLDLERVREIMEVQHNFKATARQYKCAFKRWELQKNITGDDMKHMIRIRIRRLNEEGKGTEFYLRERRVRDDKIARWDQRKGFSVLVKDFGMPPMAQTPPAIEYHTPAEANSPPASPKPSNNTNSPSAHAGMHDMVDSAQDNLCYFTSHDLNNQQRSYPDQVDSIGRWFDPRKLPFSPKTYHQAESGDSLAGSSGDDSTSQYQAVPDLSLGSSSRTISMGEGEFDESSQAGYTQKSNSSEVPSIDTPKHDQSHSPQPAAAEVPHQDEFIRLLTSLVNYDEPPDVPRIDNRTCSRSTTPGAGLNEAIYESGMPNSKNVALRGTSGSTGTNSTISPNTVHVSLLKCQVAQEELHQAVVSGDWRIIENILDSGDDPLCLRNLAKTYGLEAFNILRLAIVKDQPIAVNALLSRVLAAVGEAPMSATIERLISDAIEIALDMDRCECLRVLTKYCCFRNDFSWKSTIFLATADSALDAMRVFIEHNIDLGIPVTSSQYYALHVAVCGPGRWGLDMCRLLLQYGVQVDPKDKDGVTPLHLAVRKSSYEMDFILLLLEHGADVNMRAVCGATALHEAVTNGGQLNRQVVTTLIARGAVLNVQDIRGRTPLHGILYAHEWNDRVYTTERSSIIDSLVNAGADPNIQDRYGQTPLSYLMAYSRHPVFARAVTASLIQSGADVNIQDRQGKTPLHYAVARFGDKGLLEMILEAGADPNLQDHEGQTSLHVMIELKRVRRSRVALLLAHGAQPDIPNGREETAVDVAIRRYHEIPMKAFALLLTENLV